MDTYRFRAVFEYRRLWIKLGLEYSEVVDLSCDYPRLFSLLGRAYVTLHNIHWRARLLREMLKRRPAIKLMEE